MSHNLLRYFGFNLSICNYIILFYRELGIETVSNCKNEQQELFRLAQTMFDTKLPPGVAMLQPFSEESSIKKVGVQVRFQTP